MNTKQNLYNQCQNFLNNRLEVIQNTIADIQNSLLSETKSSAGDKHETGRAMLQLEREKAGNQLAEIQKLSEVLSKINPQSLHEKATLGSVIYTTKANYFIGISAGELKVEKETFYAISPATPIAQLLISKSVGDIAVFRQMELKITKIN